MKAQGVWDAVKPRTANTVVEVKKDKMALAAIYQGIPKDMLLSLAEKQTTKESWDALKIRFLGADRVKKARIQTLKADFEALSMKDTEVVDEFAVKVSNIVSNIHTLGETVEESYVVKKLLRAMPSKFLQIASTLEQFGDLDEMTVEEVIGRLKAHEERMWGQCDIDDKKLLLNHQEWTERSKKKTDEDSKFNHKRNRGGGSRGWGRGQNRGGNQGGRGGRGRGNSFHQKNNGNNGGSSSQDKSSMQCYNFQDYGHYAAECKNPRKERNQVNNLIHEQLDNEPTLLLASFDPTIEIGEIKLKPTIEDKRRYSETIKYVVSASNHMIGDKYKFRNLNKMIQGYVKFGNEARVRIKGKGSIVSQCKNGEHRKLDEVYYIPDLCSNIISLRQLAEGGDEIRIKDPFLWVHDTSGRLLMRVQRSPNRLYKIELLEVSSKCMIAEINEPTWLWHARMGHVNFNALKLMSEKGMVIGMPRINTPSQPCEGCLVGKQSRNSYPLRTNYRAKKRLELIHGDLCGPVSPPTPAGNKYFMLLVDDFSKVMWVYLLKTKDEAFQVFKNFRAKVEAETSEKVKILRTDHRGEFLSSQFTTYCDETGLERHYTAPYSPQQNGVVERWNRTVLEIVRNCLKTMSVPDVVWGEAVNHAVYILNRASMKALKESTPYEMWTGRKPHVSHLRVFGCAAHMMASQNHLKKLDDRSKKVVHLGVKKDTKAYRLLDPVTELMYVSKNVIFEENKAWMWEKMAKIKPTPGMSFTIEGFDFNDLDYDEVGPTPGTPDEYVVPQSEEDWIEGESHPISLQLDPQLSPHDTSLSPPSPVSQVGSSSIASSSTGGGAPKRYRFLSNLYDQTEQLMMVHDEEEPTSYTDAKKRKEWVNALKVELASIEKNNTWRLVDLPKDRKPIGLKWVFKVKRDPHGKILKHKARIVAKGYVQKQGIDYEEVFAPVARIETVRVILALAGCNGWHVHHLDVKSSFLNGKLEEEVYVSQPDGFVKRGEENKVYKLSKALYGLKQAPRAWNACLDRRKILIIGVYVDDLLVTENCHEELKCFKQEMNEKFEMSDLGLLSYYLGIEVHQNDTGITLKQEAYAKNILTKTRILHCNPTTSPLEHKVKLTKDEDGELVDPTEYRSIVGGLRYLTHTRPNISFAVGVVSRFMKRPTTKHLQAVKGILRYVRGTLDYGLVYTRGKGKVTISGYSDSDLGMDINDRRSTSGMAFYVNGNLVTWSSQKQRCVALSSCEVEFMAATSATCQGIWLRRLLTETIGEKVEPATLFVHNKSAIDLMRNQVFHGRSKHIDIRFHFIRESVENGEIKTCTLSLFCSCFIPTWLFHGNFHVKPLWMNLYFLCESQPIKQHQQQPMSNLKVRSKELIQHSPNSSSEFSFRSYSNDSSMTIIEVNTHTHFPIKLTANNFPVWRKQAWKAMSHAQSKPHQKFYQLMQQKKVSPTQQKQIQSTESGFVKIRSIILGALLGSCSETIQSVVLSAHTSYQAFKRLTESYASVSRSIIISLKSRLANNPKGTRSIMEFLHDMKNIADDLALAQSPVDEEDLVVHILSQLGEDYNNITTALKFHDTAITYPDLFEKLLDHKRTLKDTTVSPAIATVNNTQKFTNRYPTKSRNDNRYPQQFNNNQNQTTGARVSRPTNQYIGGNSYSKGNRNSSYCQYCNIPGHETKDCRKLARFLRENNITISNSASPPVNTTTAGSTSSNPPWMFDTGASHHVASTSASFQTLSEYGGPDEIVLGNAIQSLRSLPRVNSTTTSSQSISSLHHKFGHPSTKQLTSSIACLLSYSTTNHPMKNFTMHPELIPNLNHLDVYAIHGCDLTHPLNYTDDQQNAFSLVILHLSRPTNAMILQPTKYITQYMLSSLSILIPVMLIHK
uniref:Integrase catalytic domain-containing protein n=1 Tax=Lactuca sativa TaxID=4236 RepID=A0A9R1VP42_LACSA|nr:hypothetical protein LSAT_V11C500255750 [Lactuca sativa]